MAAIGKKIGSRFGYHAGEIITASRNVFTNSRKAALVEESQVICSKHSPVPLVAEGSGNVFINDRAAARKDDHITCGAVISEGSDNVFIGGGQVQYLPVESEVPEWLENAVNKVFAALEVISLFLGIGAIVKAIVKCGAKTLLQQVVKCGGKTMLAGAAGGWVGAQAEGLAGNPVEVTNGRKLLRAEAETDFELNAPLTLPVARFYGSNLDEHGSLGRGFRLPWERALIVESGRVTYIAGEGRELVFEAPAPNERFYLPEEYLYVARLADGRWILSGIDEVHWLFAPTAQDATGPHRAGVTHLLAQIEDDQGGAVRFYRDKQGHVREMGDSAGHRLLLTYQNFSIAGQRHARLIEIGQTAGGQTVKRVRYRYDARARLIEVRNALEQITRRFAWGDEGAATDLMVEHQNAMGFACRYQWQILEGQPRVVEHETSDGERYRFQYDFANRRAQVEDLSLTEAGCPAVSSGLAEPASTAVWTWDEHENILHCRDFDGRDYHYEYDACNRMTMQKLPGEAEAERIWRFEYDELGRVTVATNPEGHKTERAWAPDSLRIQSETGADGGTWRNVYEPRTGLLLSSEDPLGQKTEYEWAVPYGPCKITGPGGDAQHYEWDKRGQLTQHADCSGNLTRYCYDDNGYLSGHTDAEGRQLRQQRDLLGQLLRQEDPDGGVETLRWNALGLPTQHINRAGDVERWEYTPRGQLAAHTDFEGRKTSSTYNARQQLTRLERGEAVYRFHWDATGRLLAEQQPDGVEQRYRYGASGDLLERTDKGAGSAHPERQTRYVYDRNGQLTERHSATQTTRYAWDAMGRLAALQKTQRATDMKTCRRVHAPEDRRHSQGQNFADDDDTG